MSTRSAGRGRAAARSIRLALRSLSSVAASSASLPRWVFRCRGSRCASSASIPTASRSIPPIPIPAQPITGRGQHALSTPSTKLMDGKLFVDGHGPWLGAYQHDSKVEPGGDWAWVTGEKFTFTRWNPGEPDNETGGEPGFEPGIKSGQSEEVLQYLASGFWNDANVTAQAHGYVVEFDKPRQAACRKLG